MASYIKKFFWGIWSVIVWYFTLPYEFMLIVALLVIVALGWVSTWSVFETKTSKSSEAFTVSGDVIVQYQLSGTEVIGSFSTQAIKEIYTKVDWLGRPGYPQCVIRIPDGTLDEFKWIVESAESTLAQNSLPLGFELTGIYSLHEDGVDCELTSKKQDVYIRLSGNFDRDGNFLVLSNRTSLEYEDAWILLPADIYDQVLKGSVTNSGFSFQSFFTFSIPEKVASFVAKEGDPNGLENWVRGYEYLLEGIYRVDYTLGSEVGVVDVTTYRTVNAGTGQNKCQYRYKGNCRDLDWVPDKKTVSDTSQQSIVVGSYILVVP